jgi:hypothetical protein
MLNTETESHAENGEELTDTIATIDEGDSITCELSSPLNHADHEYANARFTVEEITNTDLSAAPGKTAVAELQLYGHALNGRNNGGIEAWSLTVKEQRDSSLTTPTITGDYHDLSEGGYVSTRAVEIASIERLEQNSE